MVRPRTAWRRRLALAGAAVAGGVILPAAALAATPTLQQEINRALTGPGVGLILAAGALVLAPTIAILLTSFTRIVVVLSFVRTAVGTPTLPPAMVVIGLALIITGYTMAPTLSAVNRVAAAPYIAGKISLGQALTRAEGPERSYLEANTQQQNIGIIYNATHARPPRAIANVPFFTLATAFAVSQLDLAFQMAISIYLPFLIVDLVVTSILMSLGMLMLPPTLVSLPIKLLLFVAVGGWGLVVGTLIASPS